MTGTPPNRPITYPFGLAGPRPGFTGSAPREAAMPRGVVQLTHQLGVSPIAADTQQAAYVLLEIAVDAAETEAQMPLNVCLVLDQSLSMRGEKMERVREAARYAIYKMAPSDVISIVTFNDRATVVCPPRFVTDPALIADTLTTVAPRGGTEMAAGMEWGISQIHDGLKLTGQAISSLLLLTDGRTYGDEEICVDLAEYARKQGFLLTSLGVGDEWNEDLLEKLASRCGSRSEYIDRPEAIAPAFREHIERLRSIVGYNARVSLLSGEGANIGAVHRVRPIVVQADSLLAAEANEQVYDIGSLVAGERQALLVEVLLPEHSPGPHKILDVTVSYQQAAVGRTRTRLEHEVPVLAAPQQLASRALAASVKGAAEKVLAYRMQKKAWQDLAEGNVVQATSRLRMVATRLIDAGEPELAAQVNAEAAYLEQNGRPSSQGPKRIKYGTRGLGHTQAPPGGAPATGQMRGN